jgi:hypothetical protein
VVKLAFVSIGTIPVLFRDRVVFYKQRDSKYYGALPFAASQFIAGLPQAIAGILALSSERSLTAIFCKRFWYIRR